MSGALHINPTKRAMVALARVDKLAQDAQISHAHAAILLIEAAPAVCLFDFPPAPFTPGPSQDRDKPYREMAAILPPPAKRSHHKKKEAAR